MWALALPQRNSGNLTNTCFSEHASPFEVGSAKVSFLIVNFYGHEKPELSGTKFDAQGWRGNVVMRNYNRRHTLKAVGITEIGANWFNYNATLGNDAKMRAGEICDEVIGSSVAKIR